ncbi:hypothetical protein DLAC_05404 [Tieghemostelium lacteum]|uniref:TraB family protein n=1 Tax=Tieghemostelium lacteum TaxID=361077 RepID=A0A151ZFX7_TIELA|nr:hypothetical protein DLAC_05404 [Tieghemostelium lacteum]|eukprot:KYQ92819.1 hypothetical protein DLAC_05404 [Tieghemostelium lacteum]
MSSELFLDDVNSQVSKLNSINNSNDIEKKEQHNSVVEDTENDLETPSSTTTYINNNITTTTTTTTTTYTTEPEQQVKIEFKLPQSAKVLYSPKTNATIILVGSVHIHQSSSDEVSEIIKEWKPDTVFIELCKSRAGLVLNNNSINKKHVDLHRDQPVNKQNFKHYHESRMHSSQQLEDQYNTTTSGQEENSSSFQDIDVNDMTEEDNEVYSNEIPQDEESEEESNELDEDEDDDEYYDDDFNRHQYKYSLYLQQHKQQQQQELQEQQHIQEEQEKLEREEEIQNITYYINRFQNDITTSDYADDEKSQSSTPYTTTPPTPVEEEQPTSFKEMLETIKNHGLPGLLQILMAELIRKAGKQSNSQPGSEFITAFLEAKKIGATVVLGDRLVEITLQRVWSSLSRWEKFKFVYSLFVASLSEVSSQEIDEIKNGDDELISKLLEEFNGKFPSVVQTIVTERDQYMAAKLRVCPGKKIVAVVGKGHINGIIREWANDQIDLVELESPTVHKKKKDLSYGSWFSKWAYLLILPIASSITIYLFNKKFNFINW